MTVGLSFGLVLVVLAVLGLGVVAALFVLGELLHELACQVLDKLLDWLTRPPRRKD